MGGDNEYRYDIYVPISFSMVYIKMIGSFGAETYVVPQEQYKSYRQGTIQNMGIGNYKYNAGNSYVVYKHGGLESHHLFIGI